jgi:insertion element IS1 protein InsB
LELDELWTFVLRKSDDVSIWFALCRQSRQVVAFVVGNRSEATCRRLWEAIPPIGRPYAAVIQPTYHRPVAKETGETAHVERHNTLRQRLGRLVRKSLSWSKATEMLVACLAVFFHRYNQEHAVILPT